MTVWLVLERHNISFSKITFFRWKYLSKSVMISAKHCFVRQDPLFPFFAIEKVEKVFAN